MRYSKCFFSTPSLLITVTIAAFGSCTSANQSNNNNPSKQQTAKDSIKKDSTGQLPIQKFINPDTAGKRTIYLTFDDGPNPGTQVVMNILKEEEVPATFFLIGKHVRNSPLGRKLIPELKAMPNAILCNHSYTHAFLNHYEKFYANTTGAIEDFMKCRDSVGLTNNLVRTPGNNIWRTPHFNQTTYKRYKTTADAIEDSGFMVLGWDTEWRFRSSKLVQTTDQMIKEIESMYTLKENKALNHCVLLMHDITFLDAADSTSLRNLIDWVKKNPQYRFDVVTNHPLVKP